MSFRSPDDAILPPAGEVDPRPAGLRPAVFVPIAVALVGVGAILFGGLTARDPATMLGKADIDTVATGSIEKPAKDIRRVRGMLDR